MSQQKPRLKRSPAQRASDADFVARLLAQGDTHSSIADKLAAERPYRLSTVQIAREVRKLTRDWKNAAAIEIANFKGLELMRLNYRERELWEAWDRSKEDRITRQIIPGSSNRGRSISVTIESQCGDVAYMRLLLEVHEQRCKLLGLYSTANQKPADAGEGYRNNLPAPVVKIVSADELPPRSTPLN